MAAILRGLVVATVGRLAAGSAGAFHSRVIAPTTGARRQGRHEQPGQQNPAQDGMNPFHAPIPASYLQPSRKEILFDLIVGPPGRARYDLPHIEGAYFPRFCPIIAPRAVPRRIKASQSRNLRLSKPMETPNFWSTNRPLRKPKKPPRAE